MCHLCLNNSQVMGDGTAVTRVQAVWEVDIGVPKIDTSVSDVFHRYAFVRGIGTGFVAVVMWIGYELVLRY